LTCIGGIIFRFIDYAFVVRRVVAAAADVAVVAAAAVVAACNRLALLKTTKRLCPCLLARMCGICRSATVQQCNSAEKASTSERYTLPPTPTRRSRCYPQLLCTRLAAPSQMKTKQKIKKRKNTNCNTGNNSMLLLRQLLFTTRQPLKLDSELGFYPGGCWRILSANY